MEHFEDDFKKVLEKYQYTNFYNINAIKEMLKTTLKPIINTVLKNVVPISVEWELDIDSIINKIEFEEIEEIFVVK